jgi:hypothetical protein
MRRGGVLFSVPHAPTFEVFTTSFEGAHVEVERRSSDWGKRGWWKRIWHTWEGLRLAWRARSFDALVLCSVSLEAFVVGWLCRWLCPRTRIVAVDFLIPKPGGMAEWLALGLRQLAAFVCIRTGDIRTLVRRFGVDRRRCGFAHYPARAIDDTPPKEGLCSGDGYLYSAGFAHRDWTTLVEALRRVSVRAILSPGFDFKLPGTLPLNIQVVPPMPPEEGRRLLAGARLAVFSLEETELPCGPLVLLDAMALGKPIIATRTNATQDYLKHGETAWMVSPRDAEALAGAIESLWDDTKLAAELGGNALQVSEQLFTSAGFMARIREACQAAEWEERAEDDAGEDLDLPRNKFYVK